MSSVALIGSALAWMVLGDRTRVMTQRRGATTMPEFFEKRFESRALKIAVALVIFVFLVPYSASVYQGLGYLFEATFGLPFELCMVILAAFTLLAVFLGGYLGSALADVVFLDPPRAGSSEAFLSALVRLAPKRVVYISCCPETLARDLRYLKKRGYAPRAAWPVDMFPWTDSIECVVPLFPAKA